MEDTTRASQLVFAAFLAASFLLDFCGGFVSEPYNVVGVNYARSTPLCNCRQAPGGNCNARRLRSAGRLCGAMAAEFRVSLRVTASGCHRSASHPVASAVVRIWQPNEDGLFDCSDGCSSRLVTDDEGRVVFTAPRPGAVVHGWGARFPMTEADGVTRFVVSYGSYATKIGFIALGNSTVEDAGATCTLRGSSSYGGLTDVDCSVLLSCYSEIPVPDRWNSHAVNRYLRYVDQRQAPLRRGRTIPGCPRNKHVTGYYRSASNAIIVELCSHTCPQRGCAASGLMEVARQRQDLYAVRLVSVLKEPNYCPGQEDNCTTGRLQRLDRADLGPGHGSVLLLDVSSLGQCCESLKHAKQYVVVGVTLPSPLLSSEDSLYGQPGSSSTPLLPSFWASALFPVKRMFKRLLKLHDH